MPEGVLNYVKTTSPATKYRKTATSLVQLSLFLHLFGKFYEEVALPFNEWLACIAGNLPEYYRAA